jgi:predicted RNA-binding Zn ribbon-like protein
MITVDAADEHLLLDLLNSTPVIAGVERDRLDETEAWTSRARSDDDATEIEGWNALLAVRSALQGIVRGDQPADVLAPFLRDVHSVPAMTSAGIEWTLHAPQEHGVAIRAVLAWNELNTSRPGRLRPCENPDCRLFLIDRSKANTARWCSMATCGNRMKARRHYEARTGGNA